MGDLFKKFFLPVIKKWIEKGYIIFDKKQKRYIIEKIFSPLAGGALFLLKEFLRKMFSSESQFLSAKDEMKTGNHMVNILFDTLMESEIHNSYQTVIYYVRAVIDFIEKILGVANTVKVIAENGIKNTSNLAVSWRNSCNTSSYNPPTMAYRDETFHCSNLTTDVRLPQYGVNGNMVNINAKNLHLEQTRSVRQEFLKDRKIVTVTDTKSMSLNVEPSQKNNGNFNTSSIVKGSKSYNGSKFKGVMKKCYYHFGNVDVETSNKDILEYLDYFLPNSNFTCQRIHSNEHGQSFKIGVNFSVKNRLEFPSIWPKGVIVSSFQFKKKNAETNSLIPINKITTFNQTNGFQHEDSVKFTGESEIENTKFKGAEERCWYYVGRVIQGVSEKDLLEGMKKIIPHGKFTCKTLKSAGRTQSFKVSINSSVKTIVESTNFWPCGVIVRPFNHSNKNKLPQIEANTIPKAITA